MSTHPPLFTALARRLSARHPVNILARRVAVQEDVDGELIKAIDRLLIRGTAFTRHPYYRPSGYSDHHERDRS